MSSAVVSTSAALGRPFVFEDEPEPELRPAGLKKPAQAQESAISRVLQSTLKNQQSTIPVVPASRLEIRPAPEMVSTGIPALDALTGGLPRGCLTEICGPASSGRTSVLLAALAAATGRGEYCALVDASDALDPQSAADAGIDLDRLLWVRCGEDSSLKNPSPLRHRETEQNGNKKPGCPISRAPSAREVRTSSQSTTNTGAPSSRSVRQGWEITSEKISSDHRLEQLLRATDLLLESGGFGLIVLDLADLPPQSARRIPLATWFRFRRAIEHKPTMLLAIEQHPIAGSCSSLLLQLACAKSSGKAMNSNPPGSSREAAPFISPARKCRVAENEQTESRSDGTKAITPANDHPAQIFPAHAQLLTGIEINAELTRSRLDRKPAQSITFATKTAWAG
jgi:RecA/RadA recombinase